MLALTTGVSLPIVACSPKKETSLHLHPKPGIIFVEKGNLYCEISDGKSLTLVAGESFALSQDTVH